MAYRPDDPYNIGIGTPDLGSINMRRVPVNNMQMAEAINYGVLPQAQETFTPEWPGVMGVSATDINRGVQEFLKNNPTPTKASFVEALEAGKFGGSTQGAFDKNVGTLFEGVPLDASFFSTEVGDVNPTFKSPKGSFGGTLDIRKDQLSSPEDLPEGFFKSVGDQTFLDDEAPYDFSGIKGQTADLSGTFGVLSENEDISRSIDEQVTEYENEYMKRTGKVPPPFYGKKKRMELQIKFLEMQKRKKEATTATTAKKKAVVEAAAKKAAEERRLVQSKKVIHDPGSGGGGGGGTWHRQTAAKEKAGQKVAGPGFGKGAYFRDGGLINFYRYGGFI